MDDRRMLLLSILYQLVRGLLGLTVVLARRVVVETDRVDGTDAVRQRRWTSSETVTPLGQAGSADPGGGCGWPVTRRRLGRGRGRSVGSPATCWLLSRRGCGGRPTTFGEARQRSGVSFMQLRSRSAVTSSGGSDSRLRSGISTYSVAELTPLWACAEPSGRTRTGKRHTLIGRA